MLGSPEYENVIIVRVDEQTIFKLLTARTGQEVIQMRRFGCVPPDARLLSVHHNHESRSFDFLMEHPEFPQSRIGQYVPVRRGEMDCIDVYRKLEPSEIKKLAGPISAF
jgi:hypothetical protein